jgi:hypothetical protein
MMKILALPAFLALLAVHPAPAFADCAMFGCANAEAFCIYRTFRPDGSRKADFRVENNSRGCWCQVEAGDTFCVTSNGARPQANCQKRPVKDISQAC